MPHKTSLVLPPLAARAGLALLLGLAALGPAACSCGIAPSTDSGVPSGDDDAGTVELVDASMVTCEDGTADCDCHTDGTCDTDLACDDGTCASCPWGSDGCPCSAAGACDGALVCDETSSACRAATACEHAGCAQHQSCDNPGGGDAVCLEACDEGYAWTGTNCEVIPSCDAAAPGFLDCDANSSHIACVDYDDGARCEGCLEGYVEVDGACYADDDCAVYCGEGRSCTLDQDAGAAQCGGCETGYIYDDSTDSCIDLITCDELTCTGDDVCVDATIDTDATCVTPANCGVGEVDTGTGTCVPCVQCYDDETPLQGVVGVGNGGVAWNSICVCELEDGYFQSIDGEVKACDADGDGWVNDDLEPVLQQNGGDNPAADEQRCTVREVSQFELVADVPDLMGLSSATTRTITVDEVVARYNLATSAVNVDAKNQAYVRLIEPEVLDVQSLFVLRYTSNDPTTRLRTYGGHTDPTAVADTDGGVADAGALEGDVGLTVHQLTAAEVNPLTKACNHDADDLNLDSFADVTQSHEAIDGSFASTVLDNTPVFYRMAYFLELHRGAWRDRAAECAFNNIFPCHGAYVISEKARTEGALSADGLELSYVDRSEDGYTADYWQQCARSRDADFLNGDTPVNMDFAGWHEDCLSSSGSCLVETDVYGDGTVVTAPHVAYDGRPIRENAAATVRPVDTSAAGGARWPGMNHHSQFKCVSGSTALDVTEAQRAAPTAYDLNVCLLEPRVVQTVASGADATNPKDPYMSCAVTEDGAVANDGFNYWAAVRPLSNDVNVAYDRGCVSEGAEWNHLCAASDVAEGSSGAVKNATATYGQLFCQCGAYRSGLTCEVGCAPADTLSSSAMPGGGADVDIIDGDLVFQRSWMCLRPTVAYDTLSGDGDNISYALVAEIPSAPTPVEALSGTDGSTTYTVSAPPPTP